MPNRFPAGRHVAAALLALTAALFFRSWLQLRLVRDGAAQPFAADLSYLLAFPLLVMLLLPVLAKDRHYLAMQYTLPSIQSVVIAVVIGLLLRLMWWLQLIAGVAFGFYRADAAVALQLRFACPPPAELLLGFVVMAILIPATEELIHRGYVQSSLRERGPVVAIAISAAVFTVFHPVGSWDFVYLAGVILGAQYWRAGNLWSSTITHATVNAMIILDWRCLRGRWNPASSELPLWLPGSLAVCGLLLAGIAIAWLLYRHPGRDE